jgi:periplasmic protein TonB
MFNNLLESKPKKQRSTGGVIASVVLHSALIVGAVFATANAAIENEKVKAEEVRFVEAPKEKPPPPKEEPPPPPPDVVVAPTPPKGFQVLVAPPKIPDVIPDVDLTKSVTNEADFSGRGVAGGTSKGVGSGPPIQTDQPYFEFQVEKPAAQIPGGPQPRYPDILRSGGVEGEVLAQFVVDTTGRADMSSFKVLKSSHDLFTAAVRNVLPQMRFIAAEVGGRKVKQLVQQPFVFNLQR